MNLVSKALGAIAGPLFDVIDKAVTDKDERNRLKAQIQSQLIDSENSIVKAQMQIILAEAGGESWLQRNWRPLVILWFAGLVGAYWFGVAPENLTPETVQSLFDIIQYALSGYIVGRSAEKITKTISGSGFMEQIKKK